MSLTRRSAVAGDSRSLSPAAAAFAAAAGGSFGMIGKIIAKPGQSRALVQLLRAGTGAMPGGRAYRVAEDRSHADTIWVTEAWDSETSHKASLALPAVRDAIRQAMPLIAGLDTVATTRPVLRP